MDFLIIDDDDVDRMLAVRTLRDSGLTIGNVVQASSADEGIHLAQSNAFDIILLDYRLPPTDGMEVLRSLRRTSQLSTAIVMLSHSNDEELALKCVEAGAQDFLMKSEVSVVRLKRAVLLAKERYNLEQQVRASHDQLRRLAEQDSLTGLSNRFFFDEALKDAIPQAKRDGSAMALLLLDLDNFKNINDTKGHGAGDIFLKEVAQRLKVPIREGDKLCRLGGDEFAILVRSLPSPAVVRLLTHRIFEALSTPVEIDGQLTPVSVSIGVANFPDCATDAVELMKCADVAMYRAKASGRNQVHYYSHEIHAQIQNRIRLEHDLTQALDKDQLMLFFQPQVDADNFDLVGVEALIRWQHPELGLIPPDEFIPIAEDSALINQIGRWVLNTACEHFRRWISLNKTKPLQFSIAANLSARQLKDAGLADYLEEVLVEHRIPASQVELELTESSLVDLSVLSELAAKGVLLALDDFGTGYSSLSQLQEYAFSILKIDKVFVQNVTDEKDASFLRAISAFAQSLGFETVAEGVETEAQRDLCAQFGINRLQGYYFSKPLPSDEFEKTWLN